jgi:TldD protein
MSLHLRKKKKIIIPDKKINWLMPRKKEKMYTFKKGFYGDVRIEHRSITRISHRMGKIMESLVRNTKGAFVRLYDGKRWYYSSTNNIEHVQQEIEKLEEIATENEFILDDPIVKQFEVNKETHYIFAEDNIAKIPLEMKKELVESYFPIFQKDPEIKMWSSRYVDRHSEYEFYSSLGANLRFDLQTCGIAYYFALADGSNVYQNGTDKGGNFFHDLKNQEQEFSNYLKECIVYFKNAKAVVPGEYEVIFAPIASGVFAHESFGHKSEADLMMGDESALKEWAIGAHIGSDILSIVDEGDILSSGYVPYDDEGTKTQKTYLIKNGILSGRLHEASTAAAFGEKTTGNARAINTEYEPIVRMRTTYIENGTSSFEDLVKSVKHGYYIKMISHGSGMSQFTIAPTLSYEIVDGKITQPVKISVVTGNVFETLGLISGVGNDLEILSFVMGGCGKMEQFPLSVGIGGPSIKVSKMKVQ